MKKIKKAPQNIKKKIYKNYEKYMYTGIAGVLMSINHKLLEIGFPPENNSHVCEIGGGFHNHFNYIKFKEIKKYTIVDDPKYFKYIRKKFKKNYPNVKLEMKNFKDESFFKKNKGKYTRVISSHTFEHLTDFEDVFIKLLKLLKPTGKMSIALPCDPGFFWRFLQLAGYLKTKKVNGFKSLSERDLAMARDHITPIQNIIKTINYYFKRKKIIYFPFLIPSSSINIFSIITLNREDFLN